MKNLTDDQIIAKALEILSSRVINGEVLASPAATADFLKLKLSDRPHEIFCVILLTAQHSVIEVEELFRGTIDGAAIYPREVVKSALIKNAAAVIFAHNHPSGVAEPSSADRRITDRLVSALGLVDVRVLDHIIVAGADHFSFAENGLL